MKESAPNTYQFRLGRAAYIRTGLLALLLLSGFLLSSLVAALLGLRLFSTYAHTFTFYLKWQDVLVALCCYITFISLGDRNSTRLNSSHSQISYAVFCLKKKKTY